MSTGAQCIQRVLLVLVLVLLASPVVAHADETEQDRVAQLIADSMRDERIVATRLSVGGVLLGDESIDAKSFAPFVAVAAQLDFWVQPRYSLHVQGSFGHLLGPVEHSEIRCPDSSPSSGCIADVQRTAAWSSLAFGATWSRTTGRRVINARADLGVLLRRYGNGRIIYQSDSTEEIAPIGELMGSDWHLSPIGTVAVGLGFYLHPMWIGVIEAEIQASAPIGTPSYMTAALNIVLHRHWDP